MTPPTNSRCSTDSSCSAGAMSLCPHLLRRTRAGSFNPPHPHLTLLRRRTAFKRHRKYAVNDPSTPLASFTLPIPVLTTSRVPVSPPLAPLHHPGFVYPIPSPFDVVMTSNSYQTTSQISCRRPFHLLRFFQHIPSLFDVVLTPNDFQRPRQSLVLPPLASLHPLASLNTPQPNSRMPCLSAVGSSSPLCFVSPTPSPLTLF